MIPIALVFDFLSSVCCWVVIKFGKSLHFESSFFTYFKAVCNDFETVEMETSNSFAIVLSVIFLLLFFGNKFIS
jgi:hypothetical protein